jgi:hypothetical protein
MGILTSAATGSRGRVTIGQESVFGRIVQPTHLFELVSESIQATETPIESAAIRGDRAKHDITRGYLDVGGDINGELAVSGFGLLLYNTLGVDYEPLNRVDGGYHARLERDLEATVLIGSDYFVEFAPETVLRFPDVAASQVKFVYRNPSISALDSIGVEAVAADEGFAYSESQEKALTYVTAKAATTLTLAGVLNESGALVALDLASKGLLYVGQNKIPVRYVSVAAGGGATVIATILAADQAIVASDVNVGDIVDVAPGLVVLDGATTLQVAIDAAIAAPGTSPVLKGSWTYLFLDDVAFTAAAYDTIYTHHMEASRKLPAGMTVEVDRDAAVFIYSGMKVNSAAFTFEPNANVTVAFSLLGREEFSIAKLVQDVSIGDTSITVIDATHFPTAGTISVGGSGVVETGITYTGKTVNGDGTITLTGIPASGAASIQYIHRTGGNVDLRTSTAIADVITGSNQPLVTFEATAYVDGSVLEVLSASVTITNNLNADKRGLGDRFRLEIVEERRMVEGSFNVEFDNGENYRKFIDGTFFFVEIRCVSEQEDDCGQGVDETGVLGQMYLIMPRVRYGGTTPNIEGESYITHDLPMMAKWDDCYNTADVIIILVNRLEEDVVA